MNNINDLSEAEEIDYTKHMGDLTLDTIKYKTKRIKKCRPIEPDSTFRTGWDLFGLILILYEAVVIPYRVAFSIPSTGYHKFFELFIDSFFITDFGLNCYTGYYKKGNLVLNRKKICKRYAKTYMVIDILAGFPYTWVIREDT